MADDRTWITPGPSQLKALTHPVRLRMLGLLRIEGPATATALARRLGLNSGATSYHLRQLAQHGFIEDDPDHAASGRERWWRATSSSTRTGHDQDAEDPESLDAYLQAVAVVLTEQVQRAIEERPLLPRAWRDASEFSDWVITLTPERAAQVRSQIADLIQAVEPDREGTPGAEEYVIQHFGFPLPGRLGGDGAPGGGRPDRSDQ